jgi:tRNA wybutosine-synthesizing protein 3
MMEVRFNAKKKSILGRLSVPDGDYTDSSPKGSIDEPIRALVGEINGTTGYVTTSSCSGRMAVYLDGPSQVPAQDVIYTNTDDAQPTASAGASGKGRGRWLFTSHDPIDLKGLSQEGAILSLLGIEPTTEPSFPKDDNVQRVHLKFEPMILHILTASPEHAQTALTAATSAGFRESGISGLLDTKGRPTPPMVAVRSSGLAFDAVIGFVFEGKVLPMVSEAYLLQQLKWANQHFQMNEERKARFRQHFLSATTSTSLTSLENAEAGQRRARPMSEKQQRKEARKEASRAQAAEVADDLSVLEPPGFDTEPESDVRILKEDPG